MKKNNILLIAVFLSGCVLGGAALYAWQQMHPAPLYASHAAPPSQEWHLPNLQDATLPPGVEEAQTPSDQQPARQLPSQLVQSELPEGVVLGSVTSLPSQEEQTPGVVLSAGQNTVVLNARRPAQRAADGSSITLIEAPVTLKRIQQVDDYKAFKRVARGSYPTADFTREEVLVLESGSNLPDNAFEIVSAAQEGGVLKVRYRVNVFGLGEKTNTHSAAKVSKTSKEIVLEQVL